MDVKLTNLLLLVSSIHALSDTFTINVNTSAPIHVTKDEFLSLGMDSNLIRNHWETWDFKSQRLKTLAKGLSPAYLRLCGTDGDRMLFRNSHPRNERISSVHPTSPGPPFPDTNFTMTAEDWDSINRFSAEVGWRIMFCFNAQLRRGDNWDTTNAKQLLKYTISKGYASNLDFELGNEPDLYFTEKHLEALTPKQVAHDYKQLRDMLDTDFKDRFSTSKLYGPGIAYVLPLAEDAEDLLYLAEFLLHTDESTLDGVTWHHYYGGKGLSYADNYTDPNILDQYVLESGRVMRTVSGSRHPQLPVWQGETSSTSAPPGGSICMSYVAGFMLLDKLGISAKLGMKLVIRQTFYGFWFALVDERLSPTPNYWVALLYRQLVGSRVLDVTVGMTGTMFIRVYANCIAHAASRQYVPSAVVIYVMNLGDSSVELNLNHVGKRAYEYVFSPGQGTNLTSTSIKLNDHLLTMMDDSKLPNLLNLGRAVVSAKNIVLAPKRYAFYVVNDASAKACV